MLRTRQLNGWLHTNYTLEEVAEMTEREPRLWSVFESLALSLIPPDKEEV